MQRESKHRFVNADARARPCVLRRASGVFFVSKASLETQTLHRARPVQNTVGAHGTARALRARTHTRHGPSRHRVAPQAARRHWSWRSRRAGRRRRRRLARACARAASVRRCSSSSRFAPPHWHESEHKASTHLVGALVLARMGAGAGSRVGRDVGKGGAAAHVVGRIEDDLHLLRPAPSAGHCHRLRARATAHVENFRNLRRACSGRAGPSRPPLHTVRGLHSAPLSHHAAEQMASRAFRPLRCGARAGLSSEAMAARVAGSGEVLDAHARRRRPWLVGHGQKSARTRCARRLLGERARFAPPRPVICAGRRLLRCLASRRPSRPPAARLAWPIASARAALLEPRTRRLYQPLCRPERARQRCGQRSNRRRCARLVQSAILCA